MRITLRVTAVFFSVVLIFYGCTTLRPYVKKSYTLNETLTAPMGGVMIAVSEGMVSVSELSGVDKTGRTQELVYSGITDKSLHIVYREYSDDMSGSYARPAFTLQLVYDLNKESTIVFREYLIDVLEANSRHIKFIIRAEPRTKG